MGTGLRLCCFSRPRHCVATRFAASRMARCLVTACRVMSHPCASSLSVWPFLSRRRSRSCRLEGSANALNTASILMALICNHLVACQGETYCEHYDLVREALVRYIILL